MQTNELIELIDRTLVDIWQNEIKSDYECGWLLKEDTLKNALYFHLRSKLGTVFEYNDVRIFTEFTDDKFKGTGCRPDMVIARVDMNAPSKYWGNNVTECLAVIEIHKLLNGTFYGSLAQCGTQLHDLTLGESVDPAFCCTANRFEGWGFLTHHIHTFFKVTIGGEDGLQQIADERCGVIRPHIPAILASLQHMHCSSSFMELLGVYYTALDAWRGGAGDLMGTCHQL